MSQDQEPGQLLAFTGKHRPPAVRMTKDRPTPADGPASLPKIERDAAVTDADHLADVACLAIAQRFGSPVVWRRRLRPAETGLYVPCVAELLASGTLRLTDWNGKEVAEFDPDEVRALVGRHL